jgi:predicted small secreted protein
LNEIWLALNEIVLDRQGQADERGLVMKRKLIGIMMGGWLLLGGLLMSGCNMFQGMARDTQESIDAFQAGPHQAYHQEARDF